MDGSGFKIKFEGFNADQHVVDMRQLGQSLIGFDRVISNGLIVLTERRLPKQRERFPLIVRAKEPIAGSVEIFGDLGPLIGCLPLIQETIATGASAIIWRWLSWVILKNGGRDEDANEHFNKLMELTKQNAADRNEDAERQRQFLLQVLDMSYAFAKHAVAPVGPSCDTVSITSSNSPTKSTVVDVAIADALRSKDNLRVGNMDKYRVRVDGFTHHNRKLKIEHPHKIGAYLTAEVRDPVFSETPNIYTEAATENSWLMVDAKPTYKGDELYTLHIMNAVRG